VPAPLIVVTRRLPQAALDILEQAGDLWVSAEERQLEPVELRDAVRGATAIVTLLHDAVDGDLLDAAGHSLRCVANVAVGYDNIDLGAARERGVVVTNTPGVLTEATADLTLALLLGITRRLGEGERLIRSGAEWSWDLEFMLGSSIQGRTLGVVGLGAIGTAVARRARAFGMRIAYAGRHDAPVALVAELDAERLELDDLLASADVVSLHLPLTAETRHLIDARRLALMKPTAVLVNSARGPIVDEEALVAALSAKRIAGAGLDVFEHEPAVHPGLRALENVLLLPHLGSATVETRTAMAVLAARNAAAVVGGEPPLTPVVD
jgi:lactate dehydrogenase-like 2-hydroxyacid dehydrogenase